MGLTLIVLNGPGKGRVFELDGSQPEVIGRAAPKLRIADTETSRRHAEVRYEKETWIIRDLGSTNGTHVNGRRLTGLTELEEGDQILVGRVLLVVGQILPIGQAATQVPVAGGAAAAAVAQAALDEAPVSRPDSPLSEAGVGADDEVDAPIPLGRAVEDEEAVAPVSRADALDDEDDDEPFDFSKLDEFAFGGKSEGPADAAADEAPAEPATADAGPERGFLSENEDILDFADEVVKRERAGLDPFDERDAREGEGGDGSAAASSEAQGTADAVSDAGDDIEPALGSASVAEVGPGAASPEAEEDEDEDPLAALARANAGKHPADEWPDLEIDFGRPVAEDDQSHIPTGAIELAVGAVETSDAADVAPPDEPAPIEEDALPEVAAASGVESLEDAEDDDSGTGLLHHVGLSAAGASGDDADGEFAGVAAKEAGESDDEPELHGDLLDEDDDPLSALAARHDETAGDGLFDDDDTPPPGNEAGMNLTGLVPAEPKDDEGPTTIIGEAVETHAPYEHRDALGSLERRRGLPQESVSAEHWVSPARRAELERQARERAAQDEADRAAAEARHVAALEALSKPSGGRRGLLTVLLSMLLIAGLGGGAWYAHTAGMVDLSEYLPRPVVESGVAVSPAPEPLNSSAPLVSGVAAEVASPPMQDQRGNSFAAIAQDDTPGPAQPSVGWDLGAAAPSSAFIDGPSLLGGSVLEKRVAGGEEAAPAPQDEPAVTPPAQASAMTPASLEPEPAPVTGATVATVEPEPAKREATVAEARPAEPASESTVSATVEQPHPEPRREPQTVAPAPVGRRVAFVVNASGAVLDTIDQLVAWTNRTIGELRPADRFTVVFFRADEAIEVPPAGLRQADDSAKAATRRWTDLAEGNVFPSGQSDPIQALRVALGYDVQDVFLLSDNSIGRGRTGEQLTAVLEQIDGLVAEHNARTGAAPVRIHTVQFFYKDAHGVLKQLANRHGGTYQFVQPEDGEEASGPDVLEALENLSAMPVQGPPAP